MGCDLVCAIGIGHVLIMHASCSAKCRSEIFSLSAIPFSWHEFRVEWAFGLGVIINVWVSSRVHRVVVMLKIYNWIPWVKSYMLSV